MPQHTLTLDEMSHINQRGLELMPFFRAYMLVVVGISLLFFGIKAIRWLLAKKSWPFKKGASVGFFASSLLVMFLSLVASHVYNNQSRPVVYIAGFFSMCVIAIIPLSFRLAGRTFSAAGQRWRGEPTVPVWDEKCFNLLSMMLPGLTMLPIVIVVGLYYGL